MKAKFIITAALALGSVYFAKAEETKLGNDIFIGVNAGVVSPITIDRAYNPVFNSINWYADIEVGKYITPLWGVRGVFGIGMQNFNKDRNQVWYSYNTDFWGKKNALFGEINLDAMFNFSHLLSRSSIPFVDFYLFAGPTVNLAARNTEFTGEAGANGDYIVRESNAFTCRAGASAGLGLMFNLNSHVALGLEARSAVAPSIFGSASRTRYAENTNRFTFRFAYTFGGKLGKDGFAARNGRVETVEVPVEVPVERIVERVVEKEVVREVELALPAATSVFFAIGKAEMDNQDRIRLQQFAKAVKEGNPSVIYTISGFADKATGNSSINNALSQKRADVVYDYLVEQGVNPSQLVKVVCGGVDNMFFDNAAYSRVTIISK